MPKITVPGINIRSPWSELLISGKKTVETRGYPLPKKYKDLDLAVIETPGSNGSFKARIIGLIRFSDSKRYESKQQWLSDFRRHLVTESEKDFSYSNNKPKWGWSVARTIKFDKPVLAPARKGIRFTAKCTIPSKYSRSAL